MPISFTVTNRFQMVPKNGNIPPIVHNILQLLLAIEDEQQRNMDKFKESKH